MSKPSTAQMTCPKCGKPFQIERWNVISADSQPELRDKMIDGSFFFQTCPHCGMRMQSAYACLYLNNEKKFVVSLQPDPRIPAPTPLMPNYRMRLERTLPKFMERIRILETGLDDLTVEMVRTLLLPQLREKFPDREISPLFLLSADNENLQFQFEPKDPKEALRIPLAMIWRYEDRVKESGFRPKVTGYLQVNEDFVRTSGILNCLKPKTEKPTEES